MYFLPNLIPYHT